MKVLLTYLSILCGLLLLSCTGNPPADMQPAPPNIRIVHCGEFTLDGTASLGITGNSLDAVERYPGFFFKKHYILVRDSLVLNQFYKDSLKTEPIRGDFSAYYDSIDVPAGQYPDFKHPVNIPDQAFYICSLKSDGILYTLYSSEKDWSIYLKVEQGNLSDSILVSKMDDGCMTADLALHDITHDGRAEIIVFNHCMTGPHEVKTVSVYRLK